MNVAACITLRFKSRDAFGNFCVSLREDHIAFNLVGFQTIVLAQTHFEQLPAQSRKLFEQFKTSSLVQIVPTAPPGKRRLPTQQEAEQLLEGLAKEF